MIRAARSLDGAVTLLYQPPPPQIIGEFGSSTLYWNGMYVSGGAVRVGGRI